MYIIIILFLFVLIFILLITKENFSNFSNQIKEYKSCLLDFSRDDLCSDIITEQKTFEREYGYISGVVDGKQRIFSIYKVINQETEEEIYYIDLGREYHYIKEVIDGDILTINNIQYTVYLFSDETYLDIVDPFYESYRYDHYMYNDPNGYDFPFAFKFGSITDSDNDYFDIYRQINQEEYNYYIGDKEVIVPLDNYNDINDNDQIKVKFDDEIYTFQENY